MLPWAGAVRLAAAAVSALLVGLRRGRLGPSGRRREPSPPWSVMPVERVDELEFSSSSRSSPGRFSSSPSVAMCKGFRSAGG